jgi:RimJ/RimL family protein N-acetyltransferase
MIKCGRVNLREAEIADRPKIFQWLAHSDITPSIMGEPTYPDQPIPTWEEFQQDYSDSYFRDTGNDKGRNFIILLGNTEIGTIGYDNLNKQLCQVDIDIWMREERYCGHGYGTEALNCIVNHLHAIYGIRTFRLDPSARNTRAIRAYEKAGFQIDKTYVWDRRPDYRDGVSMKREITEPGVVADGSRLHFGPLKLR